MTDVETADNRVFCISHEPSDGPRYEYRSNWKSTFSQILACFADSLLVVVLGTQYMMPTIILGALHNNSSEELCMNDYEAAWFGSILYLCQPVGSVASGFLCDKFGRKGSMTLINLPFIAGWILLYFASSVTWLFVAALTMGMGIGFCEAPIAAYLGEIGEPHIRGSLLSIMISAVSLGYLSSYFLGSIFDWRTFSLLNLVYPIATMIVFTQIPESPVWLIVKGHLKEAQEALAWLRGFLKPHQVKQEFDRMVKHIESSKKSETENKDAQESVCTRTSKKLKAFLDPKLYLPLRLVFITFTFTQCICLQAFKPYLVEILASFNFPVNPKLILILLGCCSFIGSMMPVFIFKFTGKRDLLLYNQFISTASVFGLGIYCAFLNPILEEGSAWRWLPVVLFSVVFFSSTMGIINIPWMLVGEVFPVQWRSIATGMCGAWAYCVTSFTARVFLPMEKGLSLSGMFFFYGVIGVAGFIYFFFCLPETEGKSLERIESYFTPYHDKKEKFALPSRENRK